MYVPVVNKHIKNGDGYVSLSRIVYFYNANDKLTFEEIYVDNLDKELKQVKPISEVCKMDKYKYLYVCKSNEIRNSGQIDEIQNKPFITPLPLSNMNVTSYFMHERVIYGKQNIHKAWDLGAPAETPVYAVCDGVVITNSFTYTENLPNTNDSNGGNHIKIKCDEVDDVQYTIWYAHLYPKSSKVKLNQRVTKGTQIAGVGTTGYSTGNHLHFQVMDKDGKNIDGMSLIDFTYNFISNKPGFKPNIPSGPLTPNNGPLVPIN